MYQYGIDINTLDTFIVRPEARTYVWGKRTVLVSLPEFRLERVDAAQGQKIALQGDGIFEFTLFVESGRANIQGLMLGEHECITLPPQRDAEISVEADLVAYLFFGPPDTISEYNKKGVPFDYRDKYWGNIQTIVSKSYAGKRLFVKKGANASLEYHCRKTEGYFIHSGKLLLRLRAGRGEDRFFTLEQGAASFMPPGLMHQRGGLEDTVIIEISTRDEDSDSFLVEDGEKHKMPNLS